MSLKVVFAVALLFSATVAIAEDETCPRVYTFTKHNCCVVARKALEAIGTNQSIIDDVSKINYGIGMGIVRSKKMINQNSKSYKQV